jgi:hypothetical protein
MRETGPSGPPSAMPSIPRMKKTYTDGEGASAWNLQARI